MTATLATQPALGGGANGMRKVKNGVAAGLVWLSLLIALVPLVWLLWTVVGKGLSAVTSSGWFTQDLGTRTNTNGGGGAFAAIIGTVEQVAACAVISVPIALLVAVYLVEYGTGKLAKLATFMIDILTGIPSIVAALFIYAVFLLALGGNFAGIYAAIALVLLMIPVVVRTTEEMLKLVPNELREASYALGVPKWRTIVKVVLPTAMSGITTGIVLGVARVAGETAPALLLVKYVANDPATNYNLFSGAQPTLTTMIRDQVNYRGNTKSTGFGGSGAQLHNYAIDRMWGAALTLIALVMLLNLAARLIGRRTKISN